MRGVVVILLGAFAVGCGSDDASSLFAVQNVGDASVDVVEDEDMAEDAGLEDASLEDGGIVQDSSDLVDADLEDAGEDASDAAVCPETCLPLDAPEELWEQPCCAPIMPECKGPGREGKPDKWCTYQCVDGRWKRQFNDLFEFCEPLYP